MANEVYKYTFSPSIDMTELEATLALSIIAVASLHGEEQARMDIDHLLDAQGRCCVIDAGTPVGISLNRLFVGYVRREFGESSFQVERLPRTQTQPAA